MAAYEQIQTGRLQADAMIVLRHEDHEEVQGLEWIARWSDAVH